MASLPEHNRIFSVQFPNGQSAQAVRIVSEVDPSVPLNLLGISTPNPVIFISGGASKMSSKDQEDAKEIIGAVAAFAQQNNIVVIDGGTESGVMKMIGDTRDAAGFTFPLIGVSPLGRVSYPGYDNPNQEAMLEDNHSHFVLVDGKNWGDETVMIVKLSYAICGQGQRPSMGILINGGKIAMQEMYLASTYPNTKQRMSIIVMEGSGRAADEISTAFRTGRTSQRILKAILAGGDVQLIGTIQGPGKMREMLAKKFLK